jgi:hypothetical protein
MHAKMHGQKESDESTGTAIFSEVPPVTEFSPNQYGIRGLNKLISEWGIGGQKPGAADKPGDKEYIVMGSTEKIPAAALPNPSAVSRQPWEAFEEVGFRCARSLITNKN